nr:hypothetical protein [Tanacetum cinerariifolium]
NSYEENVVSKTNQESPQDSNIHQLIEECSVEVPEEQKQKMEDTIALDSKLLSINSINSQRLDKKEQEVKNVVEQPAERRNQIQKSDFDFEEEIRLIENLLFDNSFPRPPEELNAEIADTIIESIPLLPIPVQDGNSQHEEIDIVTKTDDVLPPSLENDDDSSDDSLLEEVDLFLFDNSIPPGIKNVADDPEGDDSPSISRPPPEPPNDNFDLEPEVISAVMEDIDEPDEHFNLGGEIFEDVDYFPFMFVIQIFLPYLILPEISPLFLFAESEDTIFHPEIEVILCRIYVRFPRPSPWVKKGGMTVIKNDENELVATRLVTGWRVCIDYMKLNEATRKDHFPLPFMDQITLKDKLTKASILIAPNWDQPFELMCDASDYAVGAVLGQRTEKHFWPIHYASKTMNQAEANYTTTEKEM